MNVAPRDVYQNKWQQKHGKIAKKNDVPEKKLFAIIAVPTYQTEADGRKWNIWKYIRTYKSYVWAQTYIFENLW